MGFGQMSGNLNYMRAKSVSHSKDPLFSCADDILDWVA